MPRLKDIERFRRDLAALSRESEILERWGEKREEPPLPEGPDVAPGRPAAQTRPAALSPRPRPAAKPAADEGLPPDFETLLNQLPLDAEAGAKELAPPRSGMEEVEEAEALEDFDLSALAPPPGGEEVLPGFDETPAPGPGLVDSRARATPLSGLSEEGGEIPLEELLAGFSEEAAAGATAAGEGKAGEAGGESAGGFGLEDFAMPDFGGEPTAGEVPPEASAEAPQETEGLEGPAEDFSMPAFDLDAGGFGETDIGGGSAGLEAQAASAPPEEALPAEDFAMPDLGDFSPEPGPVGAPLEEAPAAEDEFSVPDMGDFGLGAEETAPAPAPTDEVEPLAQEPAAAEMPQLAPEDFSMPATGFDESSFGGGTDAFDSFSLDSSIGETSLGSEDLDSQLAALGEEVAPASTFSLDKDWGAGFEMPAAPQEKAAQAPRAAPRPKAEPTEKVRPVSLTEAEVDRLQDRLLSFPLNLRLAVEEALANELGTEAQRSKLVWYLVERKPFDEVATLVSRMTKRRISIPEGYEKSTGAAFEAEKGSFRYAFKHTILPIAKVAVLVLIAVGILGYLGWRFVYKPIAADVLYRTGYAHIAQDRFDEAEDAFTRATDIREFIVWYYRYAQAYVAKRQYLLAEKKYSDLLDRHPEERKGVLEWAALERMQLKYAEAIRILDTFILVGPDINDPRNVRALPDGSQELRTVSLDYLNKDALLLKGDIHLDWADEQPAHLEDARRAYATLIQAYGMDDLYLERMLLYFMRADILKEVLPLKTHFLQAEKVFPSASTLAELGGYLFDKGILEDVRTILGDAEAKDRKLPEVHFQLARYFHKAGNRDEERKALDNAVTTFRLVPILTRRREAMLIDTYLMRADAGLLAREYIAAESDYSAAAAEYERAVELGRIGKSPRFAAAYAGLGEVAYWQRDDLKAALSWFERAAAEGWDKPSLRYERGYILYRQDRPKEAVEQFYQAGKDGKESPYLLYAFGAALYARQDYYAAEGYWRRTVDAMNRELDLISLPVPEERASHAEIVELLMEAQNNLGAALWHVSTRTGDARRRALAVEAFTESTRLYDTLVRDQAAMPRAGSDNLGLANLKLLLHPVRGEGPALYSRLEKGMAFPKR
jgi:tetratricopeptide (TPR) repeat protein